MKQTIVSGRSRRAVARTLLALFAAPLSASAATISWNAGSGNWTDPANWSPGRVPIGPDDVQIVHTDGVMRTITFDGSVSNLGSLTLDLTGGAGPGDLVTFDVADLPAFNGLEVKGLIRVGEAGRARVVQVDHYVRTDTSLRLGSAAGSFGGYYLSGSGEVEAATIAVGQSGTGEFIQAGGTVFVDGLFVGQGPSGTGVYSLSGGTLRGTGSGSRGVTIGGGAATFNQSGGLHRQPLSLVVDGRPGIYNLGGGTLDMTNSTVDVGQGNNGTFTQTGGVATIAHLRIATDATGVGSVSISGGTLTVVNSAFVGGTATAAGGTGTFSVSGTGRATIGGKLKVWSADDRILVSGGVLSVASIDSTANPAALQWTGGELVFHGTGNSYAQMTIPAGGALGVAPGGEVVIGLPLIVPAGLGPGLKVSGGALTVPYVDLQGDSNRLSWTGGLIKMTAATPVMIPGFLPANATLSSNQHLQAAGSITIQSGASLTLNAPMQPNLPRLRTEGVLTIESGATVTLGQGGRLSTGGGGYNGGTIKFISTGGRLDVGGTFVNDGVVDGLMRIQNGGSVSGTGSAKRVEMIPGSEYHQAGGPHVIVLPVNPVTTNFLVSLGDVENFNVSSPTALGLPDAPPSAAVLPRSLGVGSQLDVRLTSVAYLTLQSSYERVRGWIDADLIVTTAAAPAAHPLVVAPVENRLARLTQWRGHTISDGVSFDQLLLIPTYAGDVNVDGIVSEADYDAIRQNMGILSASYLQGDVTLDGVVDQRDEDLVAAHLGAGSGGAMGAPLPGLVAVPEPAATLPTILAAAAALRRRYRVARPCGRA